MVQIGQTLVSLNESLSELKGTAGCSGAVYEATERHCGTWLVFGSSNTAVSELNARQSPAGDEFNEPQGPESHLQNANHRF